MNGDATNGNVSDGEKESAITKDEQDKEKEGKDEQDKEKEGKDEEDKEQEVVLIQDTGFNVTIVVPGAEDFELPVSS